VGNPVTTDEAIEILDFLMDSNIKIIYSSPFVVLKTLDLAGKYKIKSQSIFDLNLVALMIQNKIDTIITAKVNNPFKQQ
jgi:hypothetical protein